MCIRYTLSAFLLRLLPSPQLLEDYSILLAITFSFSSIAVRRRTVEAIGNDERGVCTFCASKLKLHVYAGLFVVVVLTVLFNEYIYI